MNESGENNIQKQPILEPRRARKDYLIAAIIGLITAFFVHLLIANNYTDFCNDRVWCTAVTIKTTTISLWVLYLFFPIAESLGYVVASRLFSRFLILKQAGRFAIVGLMNFSVDAGIISVLSRITGFYSGWQIIPLNVISTTIALTNSYYWNHYWTFKASSKPSQKEFIAFLVVSGIGIALNSSVVFLMTTFISPFDGVTAERLLTLSKVAATFVSLFWNFLGYKFIVFKTAPETV